MPPALDYTALTALENRVTSLHTAVGALRERTTGVEIVTARHDEQIKGANGEVSELKAMLAEIRDELRKQRGPSPWWPVAAIVVATLLNLAGLAIGLARLYK